MDRTQDSEILARRALQVQRGAARAAVLGVNDGLVSVLCIILAVAGAGGSEHNVLLAGFAGLLAGAVSMAAGEWISIQSQVELFGGVMKDVTKLMRNDRVLLTEQLTKSLGDSGYDATTAAAAVMEIATDDQRFLNLYSRQVMGFNPEELGSPWIAAGSSFALFTLGALTPLAPWFFKGDPVAVWLSIILTGIGGLIVGGYIGNSSGKNVVLAALRQLAIIIFASVVTYGVGYIFGAHVG